MALTHSLGQGMALDLSQVQSGSLLISIIVTITLVHKSDYYSLGQIPGNEIAGALTTGTSTLIEGT